MHTKNAYTTNIKSERCKWRKTSETCRWRGNTYITDTKSKRCKGMRKSERLEMKFYWDGKESLDICKWREIRTKPTHRVTTTEKAFYWDRHIYFLITTSKFGNNQNLTNFGEMF